MNSQTLADRFRDSRAAPIRLNGETVYLRYDLGPLAAAKFDVALHAKSERPQALCMAVGSGSLKVAGVKSKQLEIWSHTAPPTFSVEVLPGRDGPSPVRLWNAWRVGDLTHYGIGNVGIKVGRTNGRLILRCSDGFGPVSFDDLIVDISGLSPQAQP